MILAGERIALIIEGILFW